MFINSAGDPRRNHADFFDDLADAVNGFHHDVCLLLHVGEPLLRLSGWPKVERVLQIVDAIEALGIDPADVAPDYWHHVHNRVSVNEVPRAYTRSRHQAWLHRRRIAL